MNILSDNNFEQIYKKSSSVIKDNFKTLFYISLTISTLITIIFIINRKLISNLSTMFFVSVLFVISFFLFLMSIVYLYDKLIFSKEKFLQTFSHLIYKFPKLFLTFTLYFLLLISLYFLLIIPGILFTFFWMFFLQSFLFRNQDYLNSLNYSYNIVFVSKINLLKHIFKITLMQYQNFILVGLILFINIFIKSFLLDIILIFVLTNSVCISLFNIISFKNSLFIKYEEEYVEASKKVEDRFLYSYYDGEIETAIVTQKDVIIKNYIDKYKKSKSFDEIRKKLINDSFSADRIDTILNKYYNKE